MKGINYQKKTQRAKKRDWRRRYKLKIIANLRKQLSKACGYDYSIFERIKTEKIYPFEEEE